MKILFKGPVFNPTGIATANRELCKALNKLGANVQVTDPFRSDYEFSEGMEHFNNAIDCDKETKTIFADYPTFWNQGFGNIYGFFLHEGTRIIPGWNQLINRVEKLFVPSQATKNLFNWNDVVIPIEVVPYGTNPEIYKPSPGENPAPFKFLSVNSWTGEAGDRKGTDLLIKAFDEEFQNDDVNLVLKIGTFWQGKTDYRQKVIDLLGHDNKKIIINDEYKPENELVGFYQNADCFVAPTRGESFGLTIINAMACGLPVIVTKDINSGHMDFCKGKDSVLWIEAPTVKQGDPRFFCEGNMLAEPDLESLKKQMRYAYENNLKNKALVNSEEIRKNWSWENSAKILIEKLNSGG